MNLIRHAALGTAALLMSTLAISAASANPNPADQRQAQASAQGEAAQPDRRVCVMNEAITGTRVARRVCKTEREWIASEGAVPGRD